MAGHLTHGNSQCWKTLSPPLLCISWSLTRYDNPFLAITAHLSKRQKIRTAIEGSIVAATIMLFFALCGAWILHYLAISFSAFKIAGGIILLLVAIDMLSNRRQQRKEQGSDIISPEDNVAIFPLAIPLLAGPAAITSVILIATSLAEAYIDTRVTSVFSRITAIILAALSIQCIIDRLQTLDGLPIS